MKNVENPEKIERGEETGCSKAKQKKKKKKKIELR